MTYDPTVEKYYRAVTPEDIKLVHDKHVCNPNPNYNANGQYIGDHVATHPDGMPWFGHSFEGGFKEIYTTTKGHHDVFYLGSRMPKVNPEQGNDAYKGLYQSNAITGIFGGPDADLEKPWSEDTVYDQDGGTNTYWPEGLVESVNGISLNQFINYGNYVKAWGGRTHTGSSKTVQRSEFCSNNKFIRNGQHPTGFEFQGIPHTVGAGMPPPDGYEGHPGSTPYEHMEGDGGISFGQFAHATPDVPEIVQAYPDTGFGDTQARWDTIFKRVTSTGISSQIAHPATVMIEYKTDADLASRTYNHITNTKGTSPDFGRYIDVNLYTQDADNNNNADGPSGFSTPTFTKEDTHRIKWKNFELDDVTFRINTFLNTLAFTPNSGFAALQYSGGGTPYFVLEYKFFDALEGVWSDWRREYITEADYKANRYDHHLPFGFYCPMLEANENRYHISGLEFINMFGYYKGGTSNNWSPLRTGQITQNADTSGDESLASRTFMITCLQVQIGCTMIGSADAGETCTVGNGGGENGSSHDYFSSEIVIDFPYTPSSQLHGVAYDQMVPGNDPVDDYGIYPNMDHATLSGFLDENDPQYIFSGSWNDDEDNSAGPSYSNSLYKQKWQRKRLMPEGARKAGSIPRGDIEATLGGVTGNSGFWNQGSDKVNSGYAFPIGSESIKTVPSTLGRGFQLTAEWE